MTDNSNQNMGNRKKIIKITNILSKEKVVNIWIEILLNRVRNPNKESISVIQIILMNSLSIGTSNILELFKL